MISVEINKSEIELTENFENKICKICIILIAATHGVVLLFDPKNIIPSVINFISYIYYFPTFYLCGVIYSFCNIENYLLDNNMNEKELYFFTRYKLNFLMKWLLLNICFAYIITIFLNSEYEYYILMFLIIITTILIIGKSIGAIIFRLKNYIYDFPTKKNRLNAKINEYYHFRMIMENFLEKQKIRSFISKLKIENENEKQDHSSLSGIIFKNNKPRISQEERKSDDFIFENNKNFGAFFESEVINPNEK